MTSICIFVPVNRIVESIFINIDSGKIQGERWHAG